MALLSDPQGPVDKYTLKLLIFEVIQTFFYKVQKVALVQQDVSILHFFTT